jgi:hypothetical protein
MIAILTLLGSSWERSAEAVFYKYVDKNGVVHFTDRLESIPPEYRDQIKEYKELKQPEPPSPPEKEEAKIPAAAERERQLKEAEPKKKETDAKALEEQAVREAKLKAREEKEKRIAELQEQILAKVNEQKSLRTTWMVYDRIKINQLNQEIGTLQKEILSIQKELAEDK